MWIIYGIHMSVWIILAISFFLVHERCPVPSIMGAAQPLFLKPIAHITVIALRISSILLSVLHDFFFPTFSNDSYHLDPPSCGTIQGSVSLIFAWVCFALIIQFVVVSLIVPLDLRVVPNLTTCALPHWSFGNFPIEE
jgi:hypothetical protein